MCLLDNHIPPKDQSLNVLYQLKNETQMSGFMTVVLQRSLVRSWTPA